MAQNMNIVLENFKIQHKKRLIFLILKDHLDLGAWMLTVNRAKKSIKKGQISLLSSLLDVFDKVKCQQKYESRMSAEPADRWEGRGKNVLSCPTRCSF